MKLKAFTLIEMIIVTIITAVLTGITVELLNDAIADSKIAKSMNQIQSQGNLILQELCEPIEQIKSLSVPYFNPGINAAGTSDSIAFIIDGDHYSFFSANQNLMISQNEIQAIVAQDISELIFYFYDQNGALTPNQHQVFYIKISFKLTDNKASENYNTVCYLRQPS